MWLCQGWKEATQCTLERTYTCSNFHSCRHFTPSRCADVSFHITALPAVAALPATSVAVVAVVADVAVVVAPGERTMSKLKFSTAVCNNFENRSPVAKCALPTSSVSLSLFYSFSVSLSISISVSVSDSVCVSGKRIADYVLCTFTMCC